MRLSTWVRDESVWSTARRANEGKGKVHACADADDTSGKPEGRHREARAEWGRWNLPIKLKGGDMARAQALGRGEFPSTSQRRVPIDQPGRVPIDHPGRVPIDHPGASSHRPPRASSHRPPLSLSLGLGGASSHRPACTWQQVTSSATQREAHGIP